MLSQVLIKYCSLFIDNVNKQDIRIFLESSPQYPNLLSVIQTLQYAGISASAGKCDWDYLHNLKSPFILHLRIDAKEISSISRWNAKAGCVEVFNLTGNRWETKSRESLERVWDGIVIYTDAVAKKRRYAKATILAILCILFVPSALWLALARYGIRIFYALPMVLGLIASMFSYWHRYVAEIGIFEKVCHISSISDCEKVAKSPYSSLGWLSLDSMALAFFISQSVCMAISAALGNGAALHTLYLIAAIVVIPMASYSVYSQCRIGKVCPVCLAILACVAAEAAIFVSMPSQYLNPWVGIVWTGSMVCLACLLQLLSRELSRGQQLLDDKINMLKIKRKKEVLMLESSSITAPATPIWFGNEKAPISLTTIISPNCGHCRKVVSGLLSLMERGVEFRWNLILGKMRTGDSDVVESWIRDYISDKDVFINKMRLWSKEMIGVVPIPQKTVVNDTEVQAICQGFDRQTSALKITGYPRIILNDRLLSPVFSVKDLEFIIADSIFRYN